MVSQTDLNHSSTLTGSFFEGLDGHGDLITKIALNVLSEGPVKSMLPQLQKLAAVERFTWHQLSDRPHILSEALRGRIIALSDIQKIMDVLLPAYIRRGPQGKIYNYKSDILGEILQHIWGLIVSSGEFIDNAQLTILLKHCPKVQILGLHYTAITDTSSLSHLEYLETLNLENNFHLRDLTSLSNLKRLRRLYLGLCTEITDLAPLTKLDHLKELKLNFTNIQDTTPLSQLRCLEKLDMSCQGQPIDLSFLDTLTNLREIDLSANDLFTDLSRLAYCGRLEKLRLGDCSSLTDFTPLACLSNLTVLDLSDCDAFDGEVLRSSNNFANLKELDLTKSALLHDLHFLTNRAYLETLSLQNCEDSDLELLVKFSNLTILDLSESPLLTDLRPLVHCTSLERLTLRNCIHLTDLEPLVSFPKLRVLNLHGCENLSEESLRVLRVSMIGKVLVLYA